jgi:aryl-alcohol dehydrogenase-like predicted oxidoreductase
MGTMTFGREADAAASERMLDYFTDQGGNFVDTADMYGDGAAETVIGNWLAAHGGRDDVVLATKVFAALGAGPNAGGLSRLHIMRAAEASLRRLQTDVIDLYQIHRWDAETPVDETLRALEDLVRQGKVRYLGCSNLRAWQLARFMACAHDHKWDAFVSVQPVYNALNRAIELELLPACADFGLGVVTYNPLAGGMLTGKYRRGLPLPTGARLDAFTVYHERYYTDEALALSERFAEAARVRGISPAQLAIAWILGEPGITCPILGARNVEQLKDSLGGLGVCLTAQERGQIPAIPSGHWVGRDQVYGV